MRFAGGQLNSLLLGAYTGPTLLAESCVESELVRLQVNP